MCTPCSKGPNIDFPKSGGTDIQTMSLDIALFSKWSGTLQRGSRHKVVAPKICWKSGQPDSPRCSLDNRKDNAPAEESGFRRNGNDTHSKASRLETERRFMSPPRALSRYTGNNHPAPYSVYSNIEQVALARLLWILDACILRWGPLPLRNHPARKR